MQTKMYKNKLPLSATETPTDQTKQHFIEYPTEEKICSIFVPCVNDDIWPAQQRLESGLNGVVIDVAGKMQKRFVT